MIISNVLVLAIIASLFVSSVALANSMMFEQSVYAIDNCDSTSTCFNLPNTPTQRNSCARSSICNNIGGGNDQNNNCSRSECGNTAFGGSSNSQNIACESSSCSNDVASSSNSQNIACRSSSCTNSLFAGGSNSQSIACQSSTVCAINVGAPGSNTQNIACQSSPSCVNAGQNTNVIANGASCESHDPNTTTICQPGRTIIRPNS